MGVIKNRLNAKGGPGTHFLLLISSLLGLKLAPASAGEKIFSRIFFFADFFFFQIFFFLKRRNVEQLKKLEIWVGGSKAPFLRGVGVILNARGGS